MTATTRHSVWTWLQFTFLQEVILPPQSLSGCFSGYFSTKILYSFLFPPIWATLQSHNNYFDFTPLQHKMRRINHKYPYSVRSSNNVLSSSVLHPCIFLYKLFSKTDFPHNKRTWFTIIQSKWWNCFRYFNLDTAQKKNRPTMSHAASHQTEWNLKHTAGIKEVNRACPMFLTLGKGQCKSAARLEQS